MSGIIRRAYEAMNRHAGNLHDTFVDKNKGYEAYVEKHGYHFTDDLAAMAIGRMQNADTSEFKHGRWTVEQTKGAFKSLNPSGKYLHKVTDGDLAYAANMYYADLYPDPITSEAGCLKAATRIANDPDGYEGQIFTRWVGDLMKQNITIDWEAYV